MRYTQRDDITKKNCQTIITSDCTTQQQKQKANNLLHIATNIERTEQEKVLNQSSDFDN